MDRDGALHDINRRAPDKTYIAYNDAVSRRSGYGMPQWRSPAERAAAEKAYQDALLLATRGDLKIALGYAIEAVRCDPHHLKAAELLLTTLTTLGRNAELPWARSMVRRAAQSAALQGGVPNHRMQVRTSSELAPWKSYSFEGISLLDEQPWTTWQPQRTKAGGVGEWFELALDEAQVVTGFEVNNGFQHVADEYEGPSLGLPEGKRDLYPLNNRIKDATCSCSRTAPASRSRSRTSPRPSS